MKQIFSSIMTLAVAIAMASCGGNAKNGVREAQELSGAGATFPLPFYNVVFENFAQVNGDIVAYGGVGSGGEESFVGMDFVGEAFACTLLAVVGEIGRSKVLF